MTKKFTSKVKQLMKDKKITMQYVTDNQGLSSATIARVRTDLGISECRLSTLGRIAEALGVSTKELYDEAEVKTE